MMTDVVEPGELEAGGENVDTDDKNMLPSSENVNNENKETEMEIKDDRYAEHVTYQENGTAIYTDPETKYQYKWDKEKNEWVGVVQEAESSENAYENEHYRWCHETSKWIPKENIKETEFYKWDDETSKWIPKFSQGEEGEKRKEGEKEENGKVYYYEGDVHLYRDKDGVIFFWDTEKKAWFPRIDDDFMAMYQMNYGFIDNTTPESSKIVQEPVPAPEVNPVEVNILEDDEQQKPKKRKAPAEPPKWFAVEPEKNTKVYVSNLPNDLTEEEFIEIMSKCGMIMKDIHSHKFKVKLYRDPNGELKGDGLCHYIKVESVDLALNILDNYDVRGKKIRVQRAEFQMKGDYNPALKPKMKKKEKEKIKKLQEKLFDWRPEKMRGERAKHERVVVIKNLFDPELFDKQVHLLIDYQNDIREECSKCGTVRKVTLYDRHPDGVAQISMADPEEADLVVQLMNRRFYGSRRLTAEIWDGKAKFKIAETEAEINERIDKWNKYLEEKDSLREAAEEGEKKAANANTEEIVKND